MTKTSRKAYAESLRRQAEEARRRASYVADNAKMHNVWQELAFYMETKANKYDPPTQLRLAL
jgi:hypothetical protein